MPGHGIICPRCKEGGVSRYRRKAWMRLLPCSKHFECNNCNARFLSVFGGIMKLPLTRLRKAQDVLQTDLTSSTQSPRQERGRGSGKVRKSLTLVRVSLVLIALSSFIIYLGFGGQAVQENSRKFLQFLRITCVPQGAPVTSEPKHSPEGELVSTKTDLPKPEEKKEAPAIVPDEGKSPVANLPAEVAPSPAPEPLVSTRTDLPKPEEKKEAPAIVPGEGKSPVASIPAEVAPSPEPESLENSTQPSQIKIKKGETLSKIIGQNYPENQQIGLIAIMLANPEISKDYMIYAGQVIKLPQIDLTDNIIKLQDNFYYGLYGQYYSENDFKKHTLWLDKKSVKFIVRDTKDLAGKNVHLVILGGYEKKEDLKITLQSLKTKSE
jgi:LysM repeat protein